MIFGRKPKAGLKVSELPHICSAPWKQVHTVPAGNVKTCCFSETVLGETKREDLTKIWNSANARRLRKEFMAGKMPKDCEKCWTAESRNGWSLRQKMNAEFPLQDSDLELTASDGTYQDFRPEYLDIRFSNLCSFRCRSCGIEFSSGWYEDQKAMHPREDFIRFQPAQAVREKLLAEVLPLLPYVKEIYFAGGEPLFNPEHYLILKELIRLGRKDIHLSYNTNLSIIKYGEHDVFELWRNFDHVTITGSIDAIGAKGEYIRKGSNWARIEENLKRIQAEFPHFSVSVCCTVSAFNVRAIPEIHRYFREQNLVEENRLYLNLVQEPQHLAVSILPDNYRQATIAALEAYKLDLPSLESPKNPDKWIRQGIDSVIGALKDPWNEKGYWKFLQWNKKLDKIREENLWDAIPEMRAIHPLMNAEVRATEKWQTARDPYRYLPETTCIMPFIHLCSSNQGHVTACCVAQGHSRKADGGRHRLGEQSIAEIWNADYLKTLRQDLIANRQNPACQSCWDEEKSGKFSKRQNDNVRFKQHYRRMQAEPDFPVYFEMKLGTNCNLRCRICSSTNSVKWLPEEVAYNRVRAIEPIIETSGSGKQVYKPNQGGLHSPIVQAELEAHLQEVQHFDFSGGEPFLSKEHWDLLEKCVATGNAGHISIHYNTNGTIFPKLEQLSLWKHFQNVDVMLSIDGIGKRFELQRNPAKWDVVEANIRKLRSLGNIMVHICHSVSALNLLYLPEFIEWAETEQIHYYLNLVHDPLYMNLRMLPPQVKTEIAASLEQFIERRPDIGMGNNVVGDLKGILDFMNSGSMEEQIPEFIQFMKDCDEYRGENFAETFPELHEMLLRALPAELPPSPYEPKVLPPRPDETGKELNPHA